MLHQIYHVRKFVSGNFKKRIVFHASSRHVMTMLIDMIPF